MKKVFLCCLYGFLSNLPIVASQDFTFSQYQALPYLINPAETGNFGLLSESGMHRFGGIVRTHWEFPGTEDALYGSALGWDMRVCISNKTFLGVGATLQHTGTSGGGIYNLSGRALVSAHINLNKRMWGGLGFSFGGLNYGLNYKQLLFNEQYDQTSGDFNALLPAAETFPHENRITLDGDVGVTFGIHLGETKKGAPEQWLAMGFTLYHFTKPSYSFLPPGQDREPNVLPPGYSGQLKLRIRLERFDLPLILNAMYRRHALSQIRQWEGRQQQFVLGFGSNAIDKESTRLFVGIQARWARQPLGSRYSVKPVTYIPVARLDRGNAIFQFSFDCNTAKVYNRWGGGLELSSIWLLGKGKCPMYCPLL